MYKSLKIIMSKVRWFKGTYYSKGIKIQCNSKGDLQIALIVLWAPEGEYNGNSPS
jgi:hypothetical protein